MAAQRMVRCRGSSSANAHSDRISIGQNAVATKRSVPPSGNAAAIATPPASDGTPSAIAVRRSPVTSAASAPAQTYTPATGLAQTDASERTAAATGERRTHAQAPIANAMPTANGTRPTNRLPTAAAANSHVARSAARGAVARRFATTPKHQTDATVARPPTR